MATTITSENFLVMNQGNSPLVGYNFMLRVEGLYDLPCKSIRAFSRELEFDYVQEGGLNDYVHMLRKPISRPFTLEIERYVGVDYVDPLPEGADLLLPIILMVSRVPTQSSYIPFVCARTYVFTGCSVIKKTYGDLVGDRSELLVETTTIAYREFSVINAPWSEAALGLDDDTQVAQPPAPATNATDDLKKETDDIIKTAESELKKAETALAKSDSLKSEISSTLSKIQKVQSNLSQQIDDVSNLIQTLTSQNRQIQTEIQDLNAHMQEVSQNSGGSNEALAPFLQEYQRKKQESNEINKQIQENRLLLGNLEDAGDDADAALRDITSADNLASGKNENPNRIEEASQSKTKAQEYLNTAKEKQKELASATDLTAAKGPAASAQSQAKASIRASTAVCKQIEFFETKLKSATEFLSEYESLTESEDTTV